MGRRVALRAGDGIGPEVTAEAGRVLTASGGIELEPLPWNADHDLRTGVTLPPDGDDTLRGFDAILVGALGDPRVADNRHAHDILLGTRHLDVRAGARLRAGARREERSQSDRRDPLGRAAAGGTLGTREAGDAILRRLQ